MTQAATRPTKTESTDILTEARQQVLERGEGLSRDQVLRVLQLPDERLEELLALYPGGLTSQEVARVLADTTTPPDRTAAETALIGLLAAGRARRTPVGDDALWTAA